MSFYVEILCKLKKLRKTYAIKLLAAKPGCRIESKEVHMCSYYFSVCCSGILEVPYC